MQHLMKCDGKRASEFQHLEKLSYYCHNYFAGLDGDILYAESGDDNYTEWYICIGNDVQHKEFFAESYLSGGDVICVCRDMLDDLERRLQN